MSTFLEIVNDVARESGISGAAASVSAVTGQTGQALRFVEWVAQSYKSIQGRHYNWRWLRSRFTVNTTSGDDEYAGTDCTDSRLSAVITRFKSWIPYDDNGGPNCKIYLTSGGVGGERWLQMMPWSHFRAIYRIGSQNNGAPAYFSIDPQNNLVLGPKPDAVYTIQGEYQMSAQVLAANGDTPEMPSDYHDLIVFEALARYARFSAAPEVLAQAEREASRLTRQLEANQLPQISFAPPLA